MVEVKFGIEYETALDEEKPCKAVLSVTLPYSNDEGNTIIDTLRSSEYRLCGDLLVAHWGIPATNGEGRRKYRVFEGATWAEVEREVTNACFKYISILEQVYKQNMALQKSKPKNTSFVAVIGSDQ